MKKSSSINFYTDTLIVESLFGNNKFQKKAEDGMMSSVIESVKNYVSNQIDPNDKVGSLLNILAPGAIGMFFGGKLGWLIGLALRVFHIDVAGILRSIYDEVKSILTSKKEISSQQVDQIVQQSVQEHSGSDIVETSLETISQLDIRALKLMLVVYNPLIKKSQLFGNLFASRRAKTKSLLTRILIWIFETAIASAGLMVAGDVINKFLGRPNALDNTVQKGKPIEQSEQVSVSLPTSNQAQFTINPSYNHQLYNTSTPWIEKIINNKQNIDTMLVNFAKDVYSGLDSLDSLIRATPGFQAISDKIVWYNHSAPNDNIVFIPKIFTSKKQIVDLFIDDLAKSTNKTTESKEVKFAQSLHKNEYKMRTL